MEAKRLINCIENGDYDKVILDVYVDESKVEYQKNRYVNTINEYIKAFGNADVEIYSAPGRSEIGGNHTDHQHGEVLAASINNDAIAVVKPLSENVVKVISEGYDMITVDLDDLKLDEAKKGTTESLIKGVLYKMKDNGHKIGGFEAYITSDVLIGAGLSSSAAFETIIGTIISGLYNDMTVSAIEIAIIGQYAENVYFGKPCGLMDQMACSVGNLVHIDFANPKEPVVESVDFDMNEYGYSLCITDTKGSHADLTDEYAAVPAEMKQVAACFDKEVLLGLTTDDLINEMSLLREKAGDRGVLRAIHFINENKRVENQVAALKAKDIDAFFRLVNESGNSSYKYLQNVYSVKDVQNQNVSLALAISEELLGGDGVCRVHGGGFAGTIQSFVKNEAVAEYQKIMDLIFGEGSCSVLKIRKYGGMKVM